MLKSLEDLIVIKFFKSLILVYSFFHLLVKTEFSKFKITFYQLHFFKPEIKPFLTNFKKTNRENL